MEDAPYDFSFSGVKSAVLNHLNKCRMTGEPIVEADIAASFQQAVVDVLVDNAIRAAKDYHMDRLGDRRRRCIERGTPRGDGSSM